MLPSPHLALDLRNATLHVRHKAGPLEHTALVPQPQRNLARAAQLRHFRRLRKLCGLNGLHPFCQGNQVRALGGVGDRRVLDGCQGGRGCRKRRRR